MPKVKAAAPVGEILLIVTPNELQLIRDGYNADPGWLSDYPQSIYDTMFPAGSKAFDSFAQSIFIHGSPEPKPPTTGINGADRERSIIAILASQPNALFLAIHLYWGLAEGLSVNDICQIMLIVGGYSGFSCYTNGLNTLYKTLRALKSAVENGQPLSPQDALASIQSVFDG